MALCHTALHCTLALHAHRHSSRIHQPYFSHPECPPHTHTHKCFTHLWGPSHRGQPTCGSLIQCFTATPPMTSREAIPPLTSFVANREHSQLTWPGYRVPNIHSRLFGMAVRVHVWHALAPG